MCRSVTDGTRPKTIFHLFHQWGKWEQYIQEGTKTMVHLVGAGGSFEYSENRQRRTCLRCGKVKDGLV